MFYRLLYSFLIFISWTTIVFARGGGGGSGGGGGGGGGSGGSGSSGSSVGSIYFLIFYVVIILFMVLSIYYQKRKKIEKAKIIIEKASEEDPSWAEDGIKKRVTEVFYAFQKDWSEFNTDNMKSYLTEDYYKRMVLELSVLKSESRQNLMTSVVIKTLAILEANDEVGKKNDSFVVEINAKADDSLIDISINKNLYTDNSSFTEYWHFVREDNIWKLNIIRQKTEDVEMSEGDIENFAKKNNFYYDPDFGWLMMPNRGVIFCKNNFTSSDINNHVIGYFEDKIVEFYTFIPNTNSRNPTNYLVAQTILPILYKNILVRRKRRLFNFSPSGLRRIKTESNDFDRKFCLWAHKEDQINSFELLSPDFMEKIYELPFELNIEIVGHFLYFYSKNRKDVDYDKMLEILSSSFDEMKM